MTNADLTPARAPQPRELRRFGFVLGAAFLGLGLWWLHREFLASIVPAAIGIGAVLIGAAAIAPRTLAVPYRGWMAFATVLGEVMTRVILAVVFFAVVTPIGMALRLMRRRPLDTDFSESATYWRDHPDDRANPRHYERMF